MNSWDLSGKYKNEMLALPVHQFQTSKYRYPNSNSELTVNPLIFSTLSSQVLGTAKLSIQVLGTSKTFQPGSGYRKTFQPGSGYHKTFQPKLSVWVPQIIVVPRTWLESSEKFRQGDVHESSSKRDTVITIMYIHVRSLIGIHPPGPGQLCPRLLSPMNISLQPIDRVYIIANFLLRRRLFRHETPLVRILMQRRLLFLREALFTLVSVSKQIMCLLFVTDFSEFLFEHKHGNHPFAYRSMML